MPSDKKPVVGLVLSGGGARASYQAGVVKYIADNFSAEGMPYQLLSGVSAGAINVAALAAGAKDHKRSAERLWNIWRDIKHNQVFKTDGYSIIANGLRFLFDLSFGAPLKRGRTKYLLDTEPLRQLLQREIPFAAMRLNIKRGLLKGVSLNATNYQGGANVTFFDSAEKLPAWFRSHRISVNASITIDHVMASTAIPFFFPPVLLEGSFFGDGSVRLTSPLSPAIHMGAEKVLAVGIRSAAPLGHTLERNRLRSVSMADVMGLVLNSIFSDSLDFDVERVERINRSLSAMTPEGRASHPDRLRPVGLLVINPSVDLSLLGADQLGRFPTVLRHMLKGLGASQESGAGLFSNLAFDGSFTVRVLELGYEDARAKHEELREFFGR
ncbi:MAG: patatin-like phospholipase family protein [Nitrospinae bacterium]|nr:patatin-like phospholipase family protein [Nitrospinota bacterium]